jgi:hypothetical protein
MLVAIVAVLMLARMAENKALVSSFEAPVGRDFRRLK